jgi:hypothetical protein
MTKRNLFDIVLRILGIYFIKDILLVLPQVLSILIFFSNPEGSNNALTSLCLSLLMLLIYVLVSYCLIFKTQQIIDKLKLDTADEPIPLNIHRSTILSISILIIGGLILAQEIPVFCRQLYSYFQEWKLANIGTNPNTPYLILSGVKIVIGLLLAGGQKEIVQWIELKRKKEVAPNLDRLQ